MPFSFLTATWIKNCYICVKKIIHVKNFKKKKSNKKVKHRKNLLNTSVEIYLKKKKEFFMKINYDLKSPNSHIQIFKHTCAGILFR